MAVELPPDDGTATWAEQATGTLLGVALRRHVDEGGDPAGRDFLRMIANLCEVLGDEIPKLKAEAMRMKEAL